MARSYPIALLALLGLVWASPSLAERPVPSDRMTMALAQAVIKHAKTIKGEPRVVPEPFAGGGGAAFRVGPLYGTVLASNHSALPYDLEQWLGATLAHHQIMCGPDMSVVDLDHRTLCLKIPRAQGFVLDCRGPVYVRHSVGIVIEDDGLMVALTAHAEIAPADFDDVAPRISNEVIRFAHTLTYYVGQGWPLPPPQN